MSLYDIAIIGAGPGGYVAAIRATQLGAKVALIEKDEVGGTCLNWGCIPTKTIIASVNRLKALKRSDEFGIKFTKTPILDYGQVIERKNNVVSGLAKGIHQLISANKIDFIKGSARFESEKSLYVEEKQIEASNIIIATGSVWKTIPGFEPDSKFVLSSNELLNMVDIPASLCILGGGVVGCEFASIYRALGSKVTIVEALENIISTEDEATSRYLARSFKKQGITLLTGAKAEGLNKSSTEIELMLSGGVKVRAQKLLVSVGRKAAIDGMGLENTGVKTEKGVIITDEKMRTNVSNLYAVGDVNGKYMLAHTATHEGIVAVQNIMGIDSSMNYDAIPRPIYTDPEICGAGLTKKELDSRKIAHKTGKFSYGALSKAICDNITEGQITVYSDEKSGKILGAQLIGEHATEIGAELTLAITCGLKVSDISHAIHSHPTLSEAISEAALDCEERAIHKVYR